MQPFSMLSNPGFSSRLVFVLALVLSLLACGGPSTSPDGAAADAGADAEVDSLSPEQVAQDVLSSMDLEADPCQDFYRYACGGWVDNTELPGDQSRWVRSFSVIQERNRESIRSMLESAAANPGDDPDSRRIGHYYASCMDEEAVGAAGTEPLAPMLETIAAVEDAEGFFGAVGQLHRMAVNTLFAGAVFPDFKTPDLNIAFFFQGGLGLPDRDYYVTDDATKKELLAGYEEHVAQMLTLLDGDADVAIADAAAIVAFETELAKASRPREQMRIIEKLYNKLDISGLKELTPALSWDTYLNAIGHADLVDISVAVPEFFERLDSLVPETEPAVLQAYLRWHLLNGTASLLSSELEEASFAFYGRKLQGQQEMQPRWKRCVDDTEGALGEVVGKLFVAKHFAGDSKEKALAMIQDVEHAFEANLPSLAWMDDDTRARAKTKAQAVNNKIGYPDEWRDYSVLEFTPDAYYANAVAARAHDFDYNAEKAGKPVNPNDWGMTPQMVNAYYNPLQNEMAFPAGILQPPFFHRDFPTAMNYGAIGAVMGHELSHGFDDQGRKFAPDGELREWWEPAASERYEEQAQCVSDLYSGYEVAEGVPVNGQLTLGENIADLGGLKQAHAAYMAWEEQHGAEPAVEGLTNEQLLFVAFGQVWCGLASPEAERMLVTTDSHSPPQFRVTGPVSNNPAFAAAFQCEVGTPMNPENQCEVW